MKTTLSIAAGLALSLAAVAPAFAQSMSFPSWFNTNGTGFPITMTGATVYAPTSVYSYAQPQTYSYSQPSQYSYGYSYPQQYSYSYPQSYGYSYGYEPSDYSYGYSDYGYDDYGYEPIQTVGSGDNGCYTDYVNAVQYCF